MSRPVERIEPILNLIRQAWYANPDQRLGQLIGNAARDPDGHYRDPFNIEDDQIRKGLEQLAQNPEGYDGPVIEDQVKKLLGDLNNEDR